MKMFNREKFLEGIVDYVERALPVQRTMPNSVCDKLTEFLKSSNPKTGAGLLDAMFIEYCPEYARGESLWDLSRYGEDCPDEERTILRETAVAFGRYFLGGKDVAENGGVGLKNVFLHKHQSDALAAYRKGENIIVCTGTGSGKTECFLIPLVDKILRERKEQTLEEYKKIDSRHVHALIMYPMNALVNDQIKRLRQIISYVDFKGDLEGKRISFGRYTGDLKRQGEEDRDLLARVKECVESVQPPRIENRSGYVQVQGGIDVSRPIPSEYVTRDQWESEGPADILVTNYSMMEQLLIRPDRERIFKGGNWDFIILDEAHSYSGSLGTEIAWQMRRLERRLREFVDAKEYRLPQYIATSATLVNGEKDAQMAAAREFMRGLFPIQEREVFVGTDEFADVECPKESAAFDVPLTAEVDHLVEATAEWEEKTARRESDEKLKRFANDVRARDGRVSISDAVWLSTNERFQDVRVLREPGGWADYFIRLVAKCAEACWLDDETRNDFWRTTLHDYESGKFSPDGQFRGNKLAYLEKWRGEAACAPGGEALMDGEEFRYLMSTIPVIQDLARDADVELPTFDFSQIQVKVQFGFVETTSSDDLDKQLVDIIGRWNEIFRLDFTADDFVSVEAGYKARLAELLVARNDFRIVAEAFKKKRVREINDLTSLAGGPSSETKLLQLLQLAGLAKRAGSRKPLMDVKCHQAFRGVTDVGVWFDTDGDCHFTRSEAEYTDGDENVRRKIFSLGICRECGQLYLLGHTREQALVDGDILWRQPIGEMRFLHAVALSSEVNEIAAANEPQPFPYCDAKVKSDDRDEPMPKLERRRGAQGQGPWADWRRKYVFTAIGDHGLDLATGRFCSPAIMRDGNKSVYWCLDANNVNADDDGRGGDSGIVSFIAKCPCCRTVQSQRNGATFGLITPYEANSDQYTVAALDAFARATTESGREKDAKVLAFSDSRQGASSLVLNFEIMASRFFAETAIRSAIEKYEKREDKCKPLTIENLVKWDLLNQSVNVPGVFEIDKINPNGTRTNMNEEEAQRFVILRTLAESSSRGQSGVTFHSKTLNEIGLEPFSVGNVEIGADFQRKCLQRIFRNLVKNCVIEGSGNDWEIREHNPVYHGNGVNQPGRPGDGYARQVKFTGARGHRGERGYEYVTDAIERFVPVLVGNHDAKVKVAERFWSVLCGAGILTSPDGYTDCRKLDYSQLVSDIVVERDGVSNATADFHYPFSIQEHTAQISGLRGAFYQRRFADGKINILSCSTTFEMGIDVGGLNNVFLSNLPPGPANYRQRAGRAGRRPGALAQIVMFARQAKWEDNPLEKMLDGAVMPPKINLTNPIYKYRHFRAESLRFFFKFVAARDVLGVGKRGDRIKLYWNHFGSFLMGLRYTWENGSPRRYVKNSKAKIEHSIVEQCAVAWLSGNDACSAMAGDRYVADITDASAGDETSLTAVANRPSLDLVFQLVGDNLIHDWNGAEHWTNVTPRSDESYYFKRGGCYMPVVVQNGNPGGVTFAWPGKADVMRLPLRDHKLLLLRRMSNIDDRDCNDGDQLSKESSSYLSPECPEMVRRLLDEDTISALSSCAVIPKYGFPVDVVELVTDGRYARDVDLKRDMSIGLFEYAPGQVVVANKHKYEVYPGKRGILFNSRLFQNGDGIEGNGLKSWYCQRCECVLDHVENSQNPQCPDCGSALVDVAIVHPDAFRAEDDGHCHSFVRKAPKGKRLVRLVASDSNTSFAIPGTALEVMFDANRTIAFYNAGKGSGFNLGDGILSRAFLSHNVHTDIVVWKLDSRLFLGAGAPLGVLMPVGNMDVGGLPYGRLRFRNAMASALEAVRRAAVEVLQVQDREISAFVYPDGQSFWWVIYDAAQGGSGTVLSLAKNREDDDKVNRTIRAVLKTALEHLQSCECSGGSLDELDNRENLRRIPIPCAEYESFKTQLSGLHPENVYRAARSCTHCIAPRYAGRNAVFDRVDAAFILKAILAGNNIVETSKGSLPLAEGALPLPKGFHPRKDGESVPSEKWYYVEGDPEMKFCENASDVADPEKVVYIED